MAGGGGGDDRGNDARRDCGENVVAVDFAPFITAGRGTEVVLVIVDVLGALPVLMTHCGAFFPFLVVNILVVIAAVITIVVLVRDGGEVGAHQGDCEEK